MTKIEIVWDLPWILATFIDVCCGRDNKPLKSQPTTEESIHIFQSIQKATSQKKIVSFFLTRLCDKLIVASSNIDNPVQEVWLFISVAQFFTSYEEPAVSVLKTN
jgi:hypothetical protein